ncbi:poly-gamma-glutamate system protein [Leptospira sp. GIMC2001]|uniref:poly-gamma-glutamate system protein n=1 Tax=Leptospira sp. GIMC2001 TaxID=1513297 RepID=UPI002349BF11|nr:poly-gamma-glutamate system protein [Leptospira sp. GIMC2001]WCL49981.1 poly-gamma-glutamate system protein [Leptospira sp. GIMC2001]
MIHIYWRTAREFKAPLVAISLIAIALLFGVEKLLITKQQIFYQEKLKASKLALRMMNRIHEENMLHGRIAKMEFDPAQSGLIGLSLSDVTSNVGYIQSKKTSINPNFAAVIIQLLIKANVQPGDRVAVGMSGSFPAINIAVLSAIEVMELKPFIISSASSSQWGANHPSFIWLDMEKILYSENYITSRTNIASLGGVEDRALGMSERSKKLLNDGIKRSNLPMFNILNFEDGVNQRMNAYAKASDIHQYKAYINIGGGSLSVGTSIGKKIFKPGLIKRIPEGGFDVDSVILRFLREDIPVINLIQIETLAKRYGLPIAPKTTPKPGEGKIFSKKEYNLWLTAIALFIIVILLYLFRKKEVTDTEIIL